ncbi:MAG: hypothetical protein GY898_32810 [Proteobacteria bacterium]|nr:hypothetical protein [Pseudomonadota bacterium]
MTDVALITCEALPEPDPDAAPIAAALEAAGLTHTLLPWDAADADPGAASVALFRSCWNYPWMIDRFAAWLDVAGAATTLLNGLDVVKWNLHKRYLLDLAAAGVPTTPTEVVAAGSTETLGDILGRRGWTDVVVKPAISAGSFRTLRCGVEGQAHLADLLTAGDVLVQPYLSSVEGHGERALVWLDGHLSHAIRKTVRWQGEDELVSTEAMPISDAEAEVAAAAVAVAQARGDLLYARIDMAPNASGQPVVMELELIEPSLFFPQGGPQALERFVAGIKARIRA